MVSTPTNIIAAFSIITKKWTKSGKLNKARLGHGVIVRDGDFIVVGGTDYGELYENSFETERCTLIVDTQFTPIKCSNVDPVLDDYYYYPEMMRVPHDYCQKQIKP